MTEIVNDKQTKSNEYWKQYAIINADKVKANKKAYTERKKEIVNLMKTNILDEMGLTKEEAEKIRKNEYHRKYYQANKEKIAEKERLKYAENNEYKERKKEIMRKHISEKYKDDEFKKIIVDKVKELYKNNETYRNAVRERSYAKYNNDEDYREELLRRNRMMNILHNK